MAEPQFAQGAVDLSALAQQPKNSANEPAAHDAMQLRADNITQLIEASQQQPAVVLIGTTRSDASEALRASLGQLSTEMPGAFVFAYADADAHADVAQMFGVRALPTVVALYQGQPLANFEGEQPKEALVQWIQAIQKAIGREPTEPQGEAAPETPEDPRFAEATEALNRGDFEAAIAVYERILASEPKNTEARQARDNARLLMRLQTQQGEDPIAQANEDPTNLDYAFAAADAEIAQGTPEAGFSRLIALLRNTSGKEKDVIRERLVELFALFEPSDARVLQARADMANALF
ncbi:tetratricopeptide repeat protein [Corynebacterium gerontici]|uniref:Thioredoxin C-1 n=1 Tax=Corynebacterium gerontici TaxID=2079234 RepID=A0A3G6IZN2_9CORY|nr:tetratricopeptide repeat protein [Corynebacterium gerontici]AZA11251.1 Thioredoxin C-1 [Corynebacterium gerontici]